MLRCGTCDAEYRIARFDEDGDPDYDVEVRKCECGADMCPECAGKCECGATLCECCKEKVCRECAVIIEAE